MVDVLEMALWAAQWYPVFPCKADKRPACPGGFKLARRSPAEVRAIWALYPGDLVGMPTGPASGLDVLDIDPRHGGDGWLRAHTSLLPVTRVHRTRSGGQHWFFQHGAGVRNSAGRIGDGVDVRGQGGYVILWNCHGETVANGAALAQWPEWLRALSRPPVREAHEAAPVSLEEADARAMQMVGRGLARLQAAHPGHRHHTLRAVARIFGGLRRFFPQTDTELVTILVEHVMLAGAEDRENAERTAQWGLDKGKEQPLLTLAQPFALHPISAAVARGGVWAGVTGGSGVAAR